MNVYEYVDEKTFLFEALERIKNKSENSLRSKNIFHYVLTGGETARLLYSELKNLETDWSKWIFWFGDERCYPVNHPDLNSTMADETLLKNIPVNKNQVFKIPSYLGPVEGALEYGKFLDSSIIFDLSLLGIGEDGHVASLFPGQDIGMEANSPDVIPVMHSPKPPTERISLSMNRINRSEEIMIIAKGRSKKKIIQGLKNGDNQLPSGKVKGMGETCIYFLDI